MDLIILSGNAPENKEWAEKVGKLFKDEFDSIYIQYYEHWPNQKKIIDFNDDGKVDISDFSIFIRTIKK